MKSKKHCKRVPKKILIEYLAFWNDTKNLKKRDLCPKQGEICSRIFSPKDNFIVKISQSNEIYHAKFQGQSRSGRSGQLPKVVVVVVGICPQCKQEKTTQFLCQFIVESVGDHCLTSNNSVIASCRTAALWQEAWR